MERRWKRGRVPLYTTLQHYYFFTFTLISGIFVEDHMMNVWIMGKHACASAFAHLSICCFWLLSPTSSHLMATWFVTLAYPGALGRVPTQASRLQLGVLFQIAEKSAMNCHEFIPGTVATREHPRSFGTKADGSSTCQIFFGSGPWNWTKIKETRKGKR